MRHLKLTTTEQVIYALGGTRAVADMTGRKYNAAHNWLGFDHFPPNTFLLMQAALEERGLTAPASLWKMMEPSQ